LFSVLLFSAILLVNGQCYTCGGSIPRLGVAGGVAPTAQPCWKPVGSTSNCYLCYISNGTLIGKSQNTNNGCSGSQCTYPTSTYSSTNQLHPCTGKKGICSDPASCSVQPLVTISWPDPTNVLCACGQFQGSSSFAASSGATNVDTRQQGQNPSSSSPPTSPPGLCPSATREEIRVPCNTISHSLDCPAGVGPIPTLNNPLGGNCALCDSHTKCFSDHPAFHNSSNLCPMLRKYAREGQHPTGLLYPCMTCHRILLDDGKAICGTHISKNEMCHCGSFSLRNIANCSMDVAISSNGSYEGKICAVWNHVDSKTVQCVIEDETNKGTIRIATPDECNNAKSPIECGVHQCTGARC